MNVLITGSSGFFGSNIAKLFRANDHVVYGVSRSITNIAPYQQYSLDVTDNVAFTRLVNEKHIELIIHCAAKPIVADCAKDPYGAFKTNTLGTASVLEAARNSNVEKVIVIETDKVYGFQEKVPTNEDAELNPGSPYELSKAFSANLCDFYRDHYGMKIISVRPVNLFGPGDHSYTRLIPNAIRRIKEGRGIEVHDHAKQIYRDFIYVLDAADMVAMLALNETKHHTYNLSANDPVSIPELADRITKALDYDVDPVVVKKPGDYAEIPYQSIDGSRFNKEFNFTFTDFTTAITTTYMEHK